MELIETVNTETQVKEGYKQTEVGKIPVDWEIKDLKDVADLISGQHILSHDYNTTGVGIPYLTGPADFGLLYPIVSKWTKKPKALAVKNDILITVKGDGVGKLNFLDLNKVAISRQLMAIRANKIDSDFLYRYLDSLYNFLQDTSSGSTVPGLSRDDINKIRICFPVLHEQKAIATALSDVDALISNLDKLIAKKKAIKQGAMQQLLKSPKEGGKRLAGFEGEWEVINLGGSSILKARIGWQGLTTAEYLSSGDYFLVTGTDFKNGFIDWNNCCYVEAERYKQDPNIQLKISDVLVTKDGTIGKVAYINKLFRPATLNSGVFVIRPKQDAYDPQYLYYILRSYYFYDFLSKLSAGSTISHLYQKDFVHFTFPAPPTLAEQKAIARILAEIDTELESLEKKKIKYQAIKQGMMQELLTGKTRLV